MQLQNLIYISLIIALISLGSCIYLFTCVKKFNRLKKTFFEGTDAKDLETIIHQVADNIKGLHENQINLESQLDELRTKSRFAIQKSGLVRFNPFSDGGGNFSFCIAMLDALNNGFVITSMHGREQNRIYAKKIILGKSEIQLTQEEEQAINQANNNLKTN